MNWPATVLVKTSIVAGERTRMWASAELFAGLGSATAGSLKALVVTSRKQAQLGAVDVSVSLRLLPAGRLPTFHVFGLPGV